MALPTNPFQDSEPDVLADGPSDSELVASAQSGDSTALEKLILRHQAWIYNIAARMVWDPTDAEDVAQEVLVKAVTKLSTFEGRSSFRTWLYRIASNHVLNMQRRPTETQLSSFAQASEDLGRAPDLDLPDPGSVPVDLPLLIEEAKLGCLSAMLLCLDRRQRLVYTLVELFGASTQIAAEVMEVTPANLRQILSRARRGLYEFMEGTCGLVQSANPCRCHKKTSAFIQAGHVDPKNLRFAGADGPTVREVCPTSIELLDSKVDELHRYEQRQAPFLDPPDLAQTLRRLLGDASVREALDL